MGRKSIIAICCVAGLILAAAGTWLALRLFGVESIPPDRRVEWVMPPGKFKAAGGRISGADIKTNPGGLMDYSGRTVHLRGAVLDVRVDWKNAPTSLPFSEYAEHGYNVIRVHVDWQDLEPAPMETDVPAIIGIRAFLDAAAAAGIGVILQNTTPFGDFDRCGPFAAAPAWAFRSGLERVRATVGLDCGRAGSDPVQAVPGEFSRFHRDFLMADWTPDDIALQDHLIRSWIKLAEMISRSAGLIGYGMAASTPCPADVQAGRCDTAWAGFFDRFINGIRAVDGSALIFVGNPIPPSEGSKTPIATVVELVPVGAADFGKIPVPETNSIFAFAHRPIGDEDGFIRLLADLENRGRSFLVAIADPVAAAKFARDGADPFARVLARPRPDAVAGTGAKWGFDRLSLPAGPDDAAVEPGTTDVFTLEFDGVQAGRNQTAETTVRLPVNLRYGESGDGDSPAFTVEISDGTVDWLAGRSDTIIWRTLDTGARHQMKIAPWGGRRLDFITDLTDISAR